MYVIQNDRGAARPHPGARGGRRTVYPRVC
jgi:hypothetical protein